MTSALSVVRLVTLLLTPKQHCLERVRARTPSLCGELSIRNGRLVSEGPERQRHDSDKVSFTSPGETDHVAGEDRCSGQPRREP